MNALARRGRVRMIPALILLHEDAAVLERACVLFATAQRRDWIDRARRLLSDGRERVRTAAARALAAQRELRAGDLGGDASPRMRGYAALYVALESGREDVAADPTLARILGRDAADETPNETSQTHDEERLGVLSAIADAPKMARLRPVLDALAARGVASREARTELARAAMTQQAASAIPVLVAELGAREGREAVRAALLSFGSLGLAALRAALERPDNPRALRMHIPASLARFGTRAAVDLLLDTIEKDVDGLVRYKAIRALGRVVADRALRVDRRRLEGLAWKNLVEHFRLLGLRAPFDSSPLHAPTGILERDPTERLLVGILNDKLRQSLERAFRLLKIAHPHEDIHRVHRAYLSDDRRERDNAAEFVDALLRGRDQAALRRLLAMVGEASSVVDLVERAEELLRDSSPGTRPRTRPNTREEALARLASDGDATVAALARLHEAAASGKAVAETIGSRDRPRVELTLRSSVQEAGSHG
jgi:HEAT repeat protein